MTEKIPDDALDDFAGRTKTTTELPPLEMSDAAKERQKNAMVAKAQGTPSTPKTVQEHLESPAVQAGFARALPKHVTPDRLLAITLSALRNNKKLQACTPVSFLNTVMQSLALGLEPNTPLGLAYLVPRKKVCTLMIGYKGLTKLAYQSSFVAAINAHLVYEGEPFRYVCGTTELIEHEPSWHLKDRGPLIGGYAIAWIKGGLPIARYLPADEINAARPDYTDSGPWLTHEAEMQLKTCLRRMLKYAPLSPELNAAIVADEAAERGEAPNLLDLPEGRDADNGGEE